MTAAWLSPDAMKFTSRTTGASLLPRTSKCRMLTIRYSWIWSVPRAATMPSATSSYRLTFATLGLASRIGSSSFEGCEGNGNNYMSVEFHYYQPWSTPAIAHDYWGDACEDAGKIPAENEKTMTDFFDKAMNTWSNKGLGIVMGEWGSNRHYKSNSVKVHET